MGGGFTVATGVSCASVETCAATISYNKLFTSGTFGAPVDTLVTGSWKQASVSTAGLVPAPKFAGDATLTSISCPTSGFCVAVGSYQTSTAIEHPLIVTMTDGTWTASNPPLSGLDPPYDDTRSSTRHAYLTAVTCVTSSWCVAVGTSSELGFSETLSGGTWSDSTVQIADLSMLACPTVGWCLAADGAGQLETLSNGGWAAASVPETGLGAAQTATAGLTIADVACPASGTCVAVGSHPVTDGSEGVISTLLHGEWSSSVAPLAGVYPPPATPAFASLSGVACPSPGSCVAVGTYSVGYGAPTDTYGRQEAGLIETLSDGAWSPTSAPLTGAKPDQYSGALLKDACPATGSCVAVGYSWAPGPHAFPGGGIVESQSVGPPPGWGYWEAAANAAVEHFGAGTRPTGTGMTLTNPARK
jgi:hypothetical protein